jgi:hypothetical protein
MSQSNIKKVLQTTKEANAILIKASGTVLKSSFNTTLQIANLYKDAGLKAFNLTKDLVQKTVELTVNNQKEIIKTSGQAIKEAAQSIRQDGTDPELMTMTNARAKKVVKKRKPTGK